MQVQLHGMRSEENGPEMYLRGQKERQRIK